MLCEISCYDFFWILDSRYSGASLIFEHSPNRASETDYFEIFSALREIQLAQQLFVKFNLLLFFLIS